MIEIFKGLHPVVQSLIATFFTWLMTAIGAAMVFFAKGLNQKLFGAMLGFAVMMVMEVALG